MVSVNDLMKYLCMFSVALDYFLKFLKRIVTIKWNLFGTVDTCCHIVLMRGYTGLLPISSI